MFATNPSLGYPHFESYRLGPGLKTSCVPLTARPFVGSGDAFGRKELKGRACLGRVHAVDGKAVFVDEEGRVVRVGIGRENDEITVVEEPIANLVMPVSSVKEREMPTVVAADGETYVASAGDGMVSVIRRNGEETATAEYTIQGFPAFEIRAVRSLTAEDTNGWQAFVSRTVRTPKDARMDVSFDIAVVDIPSSTNPSTEERILVPVWTLHGAEPVEYVRWIAEAGEWIVGAAEAFTERSPMDEFTNEQSKDEEMEETETAYTWTQTHDSLSLALDLTFPPSSDSARFDPQADVLVLISADSLTLRFPEREEKSKSPILTPSQESFIRSTASGRDWWDQVHAGRGESAWTFEWIDETHGRLKIRLEKENEGVRWAEVFAPQDEEQVGESLSEGQVREAAEKMARWDVPEGDGEMGKPGLTAVVDEDLEEDDFDDDPAFSGAVGESSGAHAGTRWVLTTVGDKVVASDSTQVLSTAFADASFIVKSHLDGLLFAPKSDGWTHHATNPALAFVLASKRDTQYVRHIATPRGAVVCAFESSQPDGTGGNVYVYWPVEETGQRTKNGKSAATVAKQAVGKFVPPGVGALLGVAEVVVDGQVVVVGLCERAWCLLEGL